MSMWKSLVALAIAVPALAHPVSHARRDIDDTTVLNFALTLEHLENAFYSGGLAKYDAKAFTDAGFSKYVRGRFVEVAAHEQAHVEFLTNALGDSATQPCNYSFPYTDVKSFTALSQVLEGVGVSAYVGAASLITNKDYLQAAASVLSTEARHASWVAAAVNKQAGWSGPFDVSLGFNEVYTLAAPFITSCPDSNPALPLSAYPTLSVSPTTPKPGSSITLSYNATDSSSESSSTSTDAEATATSTDAEATATSTDAEATTTSTDVEATATSTDETTTEEATNTETAEEATATEEVTSTEEAQTTEEATATEEPTVTETTEMTTTEEATATETTSVEATTTANARREEPSSSSDSTYAVFYSGLSKQYVVISDGKVTIPDELRGTVYLSVMNGNSSDAEILAGPAVLSFPFDSNGKLITSS